MVDSKVKYGKSRRKGVWFKDVFVDDPKNLGIALAANLGLDKTDAALCGNLFYQLQMAFACADFNNSLVRSVNRNKALFNTGFKDAAGNYVYMLMSRNPKGPQPYIFKGKFCIEADIDSREFPKIPGKADIFVDPLDVVNINEIKNIEIGSYHTLVDHADRVRECLGCGSYKEVCAELNLCVHASIEYAKCNSKVLELNSYRGRLQLVIPFLDSHHRIRKELAVVLEYDTERQQLVVPTILESAFIKSDRSCKWSRSSHASWVELYGSAA